MNTWIVEYLSLIFYRLVFMSVSALCVALIMPIRPQSQYSLLGKVEKVQEIDFKQDEIKMKEQNETDKSGIISANDSKEWNTLFIADLQTQITKAHFKSLVFEHAIPLIWLCGVLFFIMYLIISRSYLSFKLKRHRKDANRYYELLMICS